MRSIFIAIIIVITGLSLYGQDKINFREFDSATYELYNKANWDSLVKLGREGIHQNLDYYYLRMRMGIANYQLGKYTFSAPHFEKALKFNSSDWSAKYYLYNSYVFAGKYGMAKRFSRSFSATQKEKMGIKKRAISGFDFNGGYLFTNNLAKNGSIDLLDGNDDFAEQLLIGDQAFLHVGLGLNVSPSFSIYAGFTYLSTQKHNRYQYLVDRYYISSTTPRPGGGYENNFSVREELKEQSFNGHISQSELYLNGRIQFDKGFSFNIFGNLLFIRLDRVDGTLFSYTRQDTLAYNRFQDEYVLINLQEYDYQFTTSDTSFINWLAGFNIQKDFNFLIVDLSASYSQLYSDKVLQLDLGLTYYPFGSLVFYGKSGGIYMNEYNRGQWRRSTFSFYQLLGVKLVQKLWLEGSFFSGDLRNITINQGSVVYNLPEKVNYLAGLKLIIFVNEHLAIDLKYDFADKSGSYYSYSNNADTYQQYFANYQNQSIIGGIRWTF